MKCKTKACKLEATVVSWHDEPEQYDIHTRLPIKWQRTIRLRCLDGHNHTTTKMVSAPDPLPAEPVKPKRIKGPVVAPVIPQPQPILTNHQRHLMRQAQRQQAREAERNAKTAAQKV